MLSDFVIKFLLLHAGLLFNNYKYLIWLDADIIFNNVLTFDIVEKEFINQTYMMSYLGRKHMYSECGILFFNMNHQYIKKYFEEVKKMYIHNKIYTLAEFHDCFAFDHVRQQFEKEYNITNFSISGLSKHINVFETTNLKHYMTHLKGKRKNTVKSIA